MSKQISTELSSTLKGHFSNLFAFIQGTNNLCSRVPKLNFIYLLRGIRLQGTTFEFDISANLKKIDFEKKLGPESGVYIQYMGSIHEKNTKGRKSCATVPLRTASHLFNVQYVL
jgi:hypothetical protein